jgi:predicted nucleic acid-binding Zn ribbon protein
MTRDCDVCGSPYEAYRRTSRFCSPRCRARNKGRPAEVSVTLA